MSRRNPRGVKESDKTEKLCGEFMSWAVGLGIEGVGKLFRDELQFAHMPLTTPTPSFDANTKRNRYPKNVPCMEETRVKLEKEKPDDTDYIHANWVRFKDHDRHYIATQGPKTNTTEDFWRMIWQQKAAVIVNLTRTEEEGKPKCAQYWPTELGEFKIYGRFRILLKKVDSESKENLHFYLLEVLPDGCSDSWIVHILHHTTWNDGCALASSMAMLRLIRTIFRVDQLASGPVVVHCSAGIGRTGTLILVDYMLFRLFGSRSSADVVDTFLQLRQQRALSVQREVQFVFVVVSVASYIGTRLPQYEADMDKLKKDYRRYLRAMEAAKKEKEQGGTKD